MDIASGIVHSCHRICEAGFSGGSCVCSDRTGTPGYGDQFVLELISAQEGEDVYEISSKDGKVVLRGNNPVALATAFNQYLKYVCKVHISWLGDHLDLPEKLPLPSETVRNTIHGKYRVYMNYCTLSYSAAWWNWDRWQREIDYMAMNSINMPLSVVAWKQCGTIHFSNIGLRMRKPVLFLPHLRMQHGNGCRFASYGGPLPKSWIDKHVVLGQQIIRRELELGMKPIQQGFSGYVPVN